MNNGKLIAIVGETATGKSSLAHRIAKDFSGEIISADSWAIYKEMDIGTAKPTEKDREEASYHLVDVVSPDEDFTAAEFKELAQNKINDIHSRGKLPIIVGGTGLYVDSVLYNYSFLPSGSDEERERLNNLSRKELLKIIKDKELSLKGIDKKNKRRLVRLIETEGARPTKDPLRENTLVIGLRYSSKNKLRKNIEKRVDRMFARGLKYEIEALAEKYGWSIEAMKGIGYQEFKEYFEGEISAQEVRRKIVRSTLHLAKRQRTWFKKSQDIHWFMEPQKAYEKIEKFIIKV